MDSFVSLTSYVEKAQGEKKVVNVDRDTILEINPTGRNVLIDYQGREIYFRFENNNALVKVSGGNQESRKVMPVQDVVPYLKSLRLDFLVDYVVKKVPFLNPEKG